MLLVVRFHSEMQVRWLSSEPFDSSEWPLISASYEISEASSRGVSGESPQGCLAVVLASPAGDPRTLELLEYIQTNTPAVPVLVHDPAASPADAVRLSRLGAHQFFSNDREGVMLLDQLRQTQTQQKNSTEEWEKQLIGQSPAMRQVRQVIRLVAQRRATVLITGETGTGKELAARAVHLASQRRRNSWVAFNCSALPENLLEAELFGSVKGAFTGALQNRIGRFEEAQGGTLFLDEIAEMDLPLQAKLLRVVQERELQRLGSSQTVHLDVRLVAAANCDLAQRVVQGRFREDLFYRLNVVPIRMPALRERREDIPQLASHFVQKICTAEKLPRKVLHSGAVERLAAYNWPGNVRQLENLIEMAVALSGDREVLRAEELPLPGGLTGKSADLPAEFISVPDQGMDYERTLARIEETILSQALQKTGGNKKAAAEMLGLKRTTLSAKVRSLQSAGVLN